MHYGPHPGGIRFIYNRLRSDSAVIDKPTFRPATLLLTLLFTGCALEYCSRSTLAFAAEQWTPIPDSHPPTPGNTPQASEPPDHGLFVSPDSSQPQTVDLFRDGNRELIPVLATPEEIKDGKDKKKNGDDKDKDKKEEMQKILQLVAEGKMTVEQAQAKLAEKPEEKNDDKEDKDKEEDKFKLLPQGWNFHAQTTIIPNLQPGIGAQYSGPNSLGPGSDREATVTSDLYLGVPLWQGAEFHADLLMWQGFGLNNSFGLEAFPNDDAFKSGTVTPRFMFSRLLVRQTVGLGGEQEDVPDGPFTLAGTRDVDRFTITAGRFSPMDIFDNNTYNHDPHTQFMSYAGTMLSWDFLGYHRIHHRNCHRTESEGMGRALWMVPDARHSEWFHLR